MATHCGAPTRDGSPCQRHVGTLGMRCFQHRTAPLTNALTQPRLRLPAQAALPPLRTVVLADPALELDIATHTRAPAGEEEGGDAGDRGGSAAGDVRAAATRGDGTRSAADAPVDPLEEAVRLLRPLPLAGDGDRAGAFEAAFLDEPATTVPAIDSIADHVPDAAADPLEEAVRLLRPPPLPADARGGAPEPEAGSPRPRAIPIPPRIGAIDGPARRTQASEAMSDDGAEPMWLDPGATPPPRPVPPTEQQSAAETQREAVSALIDPPAPPRAASAPTAPALRDQRDARAAESDQRRPPPIEPDQHGRSGTAPDERRQPESKPDDRDEGSTAREQHSRSRPAAATSPAASADTSTLGLLSRISELTEPPAPPQRDKTVAIPRTPAPATSGSRRPLFRDEFAGSAPETEPTAAPPLEVPEFLVPGFDEVVVPADPVTGKPLGTVLSAVLGPELWRRCHVEWSGAHCIALARVARAVDGLAPAAVTSLWAGATAGLRWLGATREQDELAEAVADAIAHPDEASKTNSARTIRLYGAAICAAVGRPLRRCACHRDLARDVSEELIEVGLAGLADPLPTAGGLATQVPNLGRPPRA